jgi:hypothetical protein
MPISGAMFCCQWRRTVAVHQNYLLTCLAATCPCIGPLRPASSTLLGPQPTAQEMLDTDLCTGMSIGLYDRGITPFRLLCEQKLACYPALLWCAAGITRRDWR